MKQLTKKKSIVYIGSFELPDKNAAAHRVISNGKLLKKLGFNVIYIGIDKEIAKSDSHLNSFQVDGFEFFNLRLAYPKSVYGWIKHVFNLNIVRKVIKEDPNNNVNIIIAYNYPSISLLQLLWFCKKRNIKLVGDITEWYQAIGNRFYKFIKNLDTFIRMRFINRTLDGLIAISKFLYDYYGELNVVLLPPLVDKDSSKWVNKNANNYNYCKLVYIGIPNLQKDRLDLVVNSLSRIKEKLRDFTFTIAGSTESFYLQTYNLSSIPDNLKNNLIFLGHKSHLYVIEEVKKADFLIFLRDNNIVNKAGFPTKFVESISCSTPVITNASSNIIDYMEEGNLGFLIDTSSERLIDELLISAINSSEETIQTLKTNCDQFNLFDYKYYLEPMDNFINKVLK